MHQDSTNLPARIIKNFQEGKRKFVSLYQIYGLRGTLERIWKNVILIETVCRLDKDVALPDPFVEPKIPLDMEIYSKGFDLNNWAGKKEILELRGQHGLEQFAKRFNRGDLCFAAYSNGNFVGFIWIEFPPVTEAGYSLKTNEAYTYDGWTFEAFRGNRTMPVIQQAIINHVRKNRPDIQNIVTHVATWNKASLSGDQKAGYIISRLERTIVVFGIHKKQILDKKIPPELIMHQR
ncbi:MAG: hypothetical protein IPG51_08100 [Chloroflexi bacterium]|nr:hypothetical protein [Chloroflexota bacterium]